MGTVNQVLLSEELLNHSKHKVHRLANNSFLNSQIFSIIAKVDLAMTKLSLLVTLGLLVCMKIIESQSNSLPNSKPKPNPKAKAQDVGQLRADFNQALSDRTDYASGETCYIPTQKNIFGSKSVPGGYCRKSFTYKNVEYHQCINAGPLGKDQYKGHGWCMYPDKYGWTDTWAWCGAGRNKCSWKCYKCGNVPCKKWCSIYDTCGNTLVHKNHGVDCTGCPA